MSNELGECVWEIKQDTWGTALEINTSNNLHEQTNLRFQGQYYDSETGLHYNRFRYYEPSSARYVSKDPIGLFGGLNNLAYVSDPNQWVDPLGLMAEKSDQQRNKEILERQINDRKALEKSQKEYSEWVKATDGGRNLPLDPYTIKINKEIDEQRNRDYLAARTRMDSTTVGKLNKWVKDKNDLIMKNSEAPYKPNGAIRDRELDQIARIEKCVLNNTCKPDYAYCTVGVGILSYAEVTNLHNGKVYRVGASSKPDIKGAKSIGKNAVMFLDGMMCAEIAGHFHLGDSMQLTYKSLPPFDLVS